MAEPPVHTAVDEVHAHARKTGHRWVDMAVAISAITISVISMFVAIEHGRTEEKLVASNSWPFLLFQSAQAGLTAGSRTLILRLQNSGVGPARDGVDLLAWRERPGAQAIWDRLNSSRNRLKFQACYCSVLDECWVSDLTPTARPRRVRECRAGADDYAG